MTRHFFIALMVFGSFWFSACSSNDVEKDIEDYCRCVKEANSDSARLKCREMAEEIQYKYEFDPEAAKYIKKELPKCRKNEL